MGNTFTFDAIEDTGSDLISNLTLIKTLSRASQKIYLPGSHSIETKRVDQRTAVYGTDASKLPPFRVGESVLGINYPGFLPL